MLIIGTTSSSQNQQLPYTAFATDSNTFSKTSWGTGTHDYTGYLNISVQTQIHQHTCNTKVPHNVNMVLNVHRNQKVY